MRRQPRGVVGSLLLWYESSRESSGLRGHNSMLKMKLWNRKSGAQFQPRLKYDPKLY